MSPEAKVGLLVIFVGILAVATGLFLTDLLGNWGAYHVTIQFADVQGLESGAEVRLGGVRIGRVAEVHVDGHTLKIMILGGVAPRQGEKDRT